MLETTRTATVTVALAATLAFLAVPGTAAGQVDRSEDLEAFETGFPVAADPVLDGPRVLTRPPGDGAARVSARHQQHALQAVEVARLRALARRVAHGIAQLHGVVADR